ncbi:MAG: PQQ-binding-like beta-propeller repeat protein [Brumimicrobium sp.]|nr:PQQ-binding-like beta-propeller repeat protein [Brumimicrobium sp.]
MNYFEKTPCKGKIKKTFAVPEVTGDGPINVHGNYFVYSHWSKKGVQTDQGPALISREGEVIWKTVLPSKDLYNSLRSLPLLHNDVIYCITAGYILAIGPDKGNILWECKISGLQYYSSPVAWKDYVIINPEKEILILDAHTGKTIKKISISTFGNLFIDENILYFRKENEVGGIDLSDLSEIIHIPCAPLIPNDNRSNVAVQGNHIIFGTRNLFGVPCITSFSKDQRKFQWSCMSDIGLVVLASSPDFIVCSNGKDSVSCINLQNGICVWTWNSYESLSASIGSAVICKDVIYVTYNDNMGEQLKAFQLDSGKILWTMENVRWTSYPLPEDSAVIIQHTFNGGNKLVKYSEQG